MCSPIAWPLGTDHGAERVTPLHLKRSGAHSRQGRATGGMATNNLIILLPLASSRNFKERARLQICVYTYSHGPAHHITMARAALAQFPSLCPWYAKGGGQRTLSQS